MSKRAAAAAAAASAADANSDDECAGVRLTNNASGWTNFDAYSVTASSTLPRERMNKSNQLVLWLEYFVLVRDGNECTSPLNHKEIFSAFLAVITISNDEQKKVLGGVIDSIIAEMQFDEDDGENITFYLEWVLLNDHLRYFWIERAFKGRNPLKYVDVPRMVPKLVEKLRICVATNGYDFIAHFPTFIAGMQREATELVRKINIRNLGEMDEFPTLYKPLYHTLGLM